MGKFIDITGQVFGRLTVIRLAEERDTLRRFLWHCMCQCGELPIVSGEALKSGNTRSCGCLFREVLIQRNTTHGLRHTPEWHIWAQMIGRCRNPRNKGYKNYGARGITIEDPRWFNFAHFIADMGPRPSRELTLERLNNDRGYYKDNCAWKTRAEQSRNKRNLRWITFRGETKVLTDWANAKGLRPVTLLFRFKRGWSIEKALMTPVLNMNKRRRAMTHKS